MKFSDLIPKRFIRVVSSTGAVILMYAGLVIATTLASIPAAILGTIGLANIVFYSAATAGVLAGFAAYTAINSRLKRWPFEEGQTYPAIFPNWVPFNKNQFLDKMAYGIKSVFTEMKNEFKSVWGSIKSGIMMLGALASTFSNKKTGTKQDNHPPHTPYQDDGIVYYNDTPKAKETIQKPSSAEKKGALTFVFDAVMDTLHLKPKAEQLKPKQPDKPNRTKVK